MTITVVIPAVNEAARIGAAVRSAFPGADSVIMVDGGSTDGTQDIARSLGAVVVDSPPGRGVQMDAGAERAAGDIFLFLHADTVLPEGWDAAVNVAMADGRNAGGAFTLSIDSAGKGFRLVEFFVRQRSRLLGLVYGDQAIFARRSSFFAAGGFRKLPLMEDVDCVKRLRGQGRVVLLDARVRTSARRWAKRGVVGTTARNMLFIMLYYAGVSPEWLCRMYYSGAGRRGTGDESGIL